MTAVLILVAVLYTPRLRRLAVTVGLRPREGNSILIATMLTRLVVDMGHRSHQTEALTVIGQHRFRLTAANLPNRSIRIQSTEAVEVGAAVGRLGRLVLVG